MVVNSVSTFQETLNSSVAIHPVSRYVKSNALSGRIFEAEKKAPSIMMLHGGGSSASKIYNDLAHYLAEKGLSSVVFDHTGWGETGGDQTKTNLHARIEEAMEFSNLLDNGRDKVIIAMSMGGHTALEVLPQLNVSHLILLCPAAYATESVQVNFGPDFSKILRQEESYKNTHVFENLESFKGKVLHIIGEMDGIIPPGVTQLYKEYAPQAEYITLPDAPHQIMKWLSENPTHRETVFQKIVEFIQS